MADSPYSGAVILESSPCLVHIETRDGRDFWIRKETFTAAQTLGAPKKPKVVGHRDLATGKIIRDGR